MIYQTKKICGIIIIISFILFLSIPGITLEVETHRAINEHIADKNIIFYGFSLHKYLRDQLGIVNGSEEYINNKKIFQWLSDGGEFEDKPSACVPYLRSRNHFHNPINESGFSGIWDIGFMEGVSVIDWVNQPESTQICGHYSWRDARKYYYAALTARDKATRETNLAETFRALGQCMHLMQDMSVPEHTRNDGHYSYYDYEVWAKRLKASNFSPISFTQNAAFPFSINNFFDTNQYNGTNPYITMQPAIGLAEYSNANFLSPDTIFTGFNHPAYSNVTPRVESDTNTGKSKIYMNKSGNGEDVAYLARARNFYNYLPDDYKKYALTLSDEKVYNNYAAKLIPRAIGYSSQVLNYFFRGQLDVALGDGYIRIKNISAETISGGMFELYYDNAVGERYLLTSAQADTLTPGAEQTVTLSYPAGATAYMLVYYGTHGNETNALIPLHIFYGEVWVAGENLYGCLGTGQDYSIIDIPWGPFNTATTIWPQSIKRYMVQLTYPYLVDIFRENYFNGYQLKYDLDDVYIIDDYYYADYLLDETSLPNSIVEDWGGQWRTLIYSGFIEGYGYYYKYWESGVSHYLTWPVYRYKSISLLGSFVWADTFHGSSFLIDKNGKMYCSGGNISGQLGIGKAIGFTRSESGSLIPKYYTTVFTEVPGEWKQVKTIDQGGAGTEQFTWALKADGTLWVAGYNGGGLGGSVITTFAKIDDTVWKCLFFVGTTPGVLKEVADAYELYLLSSEQGGSVLTLWQTISKAEWVSLLGDITPEQYVTSQQGYGGITGQYTFIGGSMADNYSKSYGTLWSVDEAYGFPPMNEVPGMDWLLTAGAPVRGVAWNEGRNQYEQSPVITGGQTIAIRIYP